MPGPAMAEEPPLGIVQQGNGSGWQWIVLPTPEGGRDLTVWRQAGDGETVSGRYDLSACIFRDADPEEGIRGYRLTGRDAGIIGTVCQRDDGAQHVMLFDPAVDPAYPVAALSGTVRAGIEWQNNRVLLYEESAADESPEGQAEVEMARTEMTWPIDAEALLREAGFQPFEAGQVPPPRIDWHREELRFIARLETIIRHRDLIALRDILAEDIMSSFGGNGGIEEFFNVWNLNENPEEAELWPLLDELLTEGPSIAPNADVEAAGPSEPRPLVFPYVFQAFPDGRDAFSFGVVMGVDVPLRATPSRTARIEGRLSHALVRPMGRAQGLDGRDGDWVLVADHDGTIGYVPEEYYASPVGYRALFTPGPGGYRLTQLVAGN